MNGSSTSLQGVTIRDVAQRAGVSKSTVSLALRGDPRIAEATREKIMRAAKALDYRPDPLVGVLLSQVRRGAGRVYQSTLAMVEAFQVRDEWKRYHSMRSIAAGAEARARELGYGWEHHWLLDPDSSQDRLYSMLRARGIQGLLIMSEPHVVTMPLDSFALANVRTLEANYPSAAVDSLRLANHLRLGLTARGYQRIGYLQCEFVPKSSNGMSHWPYRLRRMSTDEIEAEMLVVHEKGPFQFYHDLKKVFWPWFRKYRPDVIVGTEEKIYDWLLEQGLRVPEDVGFAMLDRDPGDPRFAGVEARHFQHGAAAVDLVAGQLQRGERGLREHPKRVFLEPEWVDGPSAPGAFILKRRRVKNG